MENSIWKLSDDEFKELIKSSLNIKEVLFKLNLTATGNSWGYNQVRSRMQAIGLLYSDFKGRSTQVVLNKVIPNEVIFSSNTKHARNIVRSRIIQDNLLEYKCSKCGVSEWNGKALSLELDHINGINYDNRLENLRFLCPNCHSQITTYGSKNKQLTSSSYDISEELRDQVIKECASIKNVKTIADKLGIKLVVVKKIVSESGINLSNQRLVVQYDKEYNELQRFGSINEVARFLIDNNLVRTSLIKTARNTFLRNYKEFWNNSYWKLMDL